MSFNKNMSKREMKDTCRKLYDQRVHPREIAKMMVSEGIKTVKGRDPNKSYVYKILNLKKFTLTRGRKKEGQLPSKENKPVSKAVYFDRNLIKTILETQSLSPNDRIAMALLALS